MQPNIKPYSTKLIIIPSNLTKHKIQTVRNTTTAVEHRGKVNVLSPVSVQTHATNARALRKEKYASKIKSVQEMQQMQENYASKKNKSAQAQVNQLTQAVIVQENATIESILFFMQRKRLRASEWKPGFTLLVMVLSRFNTRGRRVKCGALKRRTASNACHQKGRGSSGR